jgi:four helix bundle protein
MQDYRKLRVWKNAFALALNTRRATASFPRSGFAELKAQMISAAESIVLNIVEGCGASTQRELARFLDIAIKSSMELEAQFGLARGYKIISDTEWTGRTEENIELRKGLCVLRKKVLTRLVLPKPEAPPSSTPKPREDASAQRIPDEACDPSQSIRYRTTRNG